MMQSPENPGEDDHGGRRESKEEGEAEAATMESGANRTAVPATGGEGIISPCLHQSSPPVRSVPRFIT
ncbi:hypothetical protein GUJ93_ZPchr0007g4619 [Zizania palustris]|uniref:Uncharacterized protein n=1 Tax=Zizania palustris TaxID=103762 RepID=A0A8J5TEU6_ZIZPA|nr:hypothetical protein GUJ93_ZPchr0007g4619 [Zizania palustris]